MTIIKCGCHRVCGTSSRAHAKQLVDTPPPRHFHFPLPIPRSGAIISRDRVRRSVGAWYVTTFAWPSRASHRIASCRKRKEENARGVGGGRSVCVLYTDGQSTYMNGALDYTFRVDPINCASIDREYIYIYSRIR